MAANERDNVVVPFVRPLPGQRRVSGFRKALQGLKILMEFRPDKALQIVDRWLELELITDDERLAYYQFFEVFP